MLKGVLKSLVTTILLGALLCLGILFLVPVLISDDTYKSLIQETAKARFDTDISIRGDIDVSVIPSIQVSAGDILLEKSGLTFELVTAKLDLLALLYNKADLVVKLFSGGKKVEIRTVLSQLDNLRADAPAVAAISLHGMDHAAEAKGILQFTDNYKKIAFTKNTIQLDDSLAQGDILADLTGGKPVIRAAMAFDTLNVLHLAALAALPDAFTGAKTAKPFVSAAMAQDALPWSTDPLALSALNSFNAEIQLSANTILLSDTLSMKNVQAAAVVNNGVLSTELTQSELFGGQIIGIVTLDNTGEKPKATASLSLSEIETGPLVMALSGEDIIEGKANAEVNLNSFGISQRGMINHLQGKGWLSLANSRIKGINLTALGTLQQSFQQMLTGKRSYTQINTLMANFTIENGILSNKDLILQAPLTTFKGHGTINLAKLLIDYELVSRLMLVGAAQEAIAQVPVTIRGDLRNPKIRANLQQNLLNTLQKVVPVPLPGQRSPDNGGASPLNFKELGKQLQDTFKGLVNLLNPSSQ